MSRFLPTLVTVIALVGGTLAAIAEPLHDAAKDGDIEQVKALLINKGADVNGPNDIGNMPLHLAAFEGHTELVGLLIENGADLNVLGAGGFGQTPISRAVVGGHADVIELLLAKGADVNVHSITRSSSRVTAIHRAARDGDVAIIELLIGHGADLSLEAGPRRPLLGTPLDVAVFAGHEEAAELLRQHGAPKGSGYPE